jgi:AraC-like DNA-binding protein
MERTGAGLSLFMTMGGCPNACHHNGIRIMNTSEQTEILKVQAHSLPVSAPLAPFVEALVWAQFDPADHTFTTSLAPHAGCLLNVNLGHPDASASDGRNQVKSITVRRLNPLNGVFTTRPSGCSSLLALLTPAAAIHLMREQRLGETTADRWSLRDLMGEQVERQLIQGIEQAQTSGEQLQQLAGWLEQTLLGASPQARHGRQLARALQAMETRPQAHLSEVCNDVGIGRRTMERHVKDWLGTTPNQHQRIVRLQHAARLAWRREKAVDIAGDLGFCDQAHLSRTVSGLTGIKAGTFMGAVASPLASTFRQATNGVNLLPTAFKPVVADLAA